MKNHEFTMIATQIANRASSWAHRNLTRGATYAMEDMPLETRVRFCDEIKEMLADIQRGL